MKGMIGRQLISQLKATGKQYDVWDSKQPGFILRVTATGKMNYVCQYARGKRINIGAVTLLTPAQARDKAKEILGKAATGHYPTKTNGAEQDNTPTFKQFCITMYEPYLKEHLKAYKQEIVRLYSFFDQFGDRPITEITLLDAEQWRTHRLKKDKVTKATVNRYTARLKAAFSKAVDWGLLASHPLSKLKQFKEDEGIVRYLSPSEEKSLRQALDQREEKLQQARMRANAWRQERNYALLPEIKQNHFVDHLKPMVLISMNTGIRQGELFKLQWDWVDFGSKILNIGGKATKATRTRSIPLNTEAFSVLQQWYDQSSEHGKLVFPNEHNQPFNNVRKSWQTLLGQAKIDNFRWHDLRHHFASKVVMATGDLNLVRELLGHADIKITLRYAHLAPEHKRRAIEKIVFEGGNL